jgi:hypothetical protein
MTQRRRLASLPKTNGNSRRETGAATGNESKADAAKCGSAFALNLKMGGEKQ